MSTRVSPILTSALVVSKMRYCYRIWVVLLTKPATRWVCAFWKIYAPDLTANDPETKSPEQGWLLPKPQLTPSGVSPDFCPDKQVLMSTRVSPILTSALVVSKMRCCYRIWVVLLTKPATRWVCAFWKIYAPDLTANDPETKSPEQGS